MKEEQFNLGSLGKVILRRGQGQWWQVMECEQYSKLRLDSAFM